MLIENLTGELKCQKFSIKQVGGNKKPIFKQNMKNFRACSKITDDVELRYPSATPNQFMKGDF